jgi:hypothetical protein
VVNCHQYFLLYKSYSVTCENSSRRSLNGNSEKYFRRKRWKNGLFRCLNTFFPGVYAYLFKLRALQLTLSRHMQIIYDIVSTSPQFCSMVYTNDDLTEHVCDFSWSFIVRLPMIAQSLRFFLQGSLNLKDFFFHPSILSVF